MRIVGYSLMFLAAILWPIDHVSGEETGNQLPVAATDAVNIVSFMDTYCTSCHEGDEAAAELSFEKFQTAAELGQAHATIDKMLRMLRSKKMPPESEPQPPADERKQVTDWLAARLAEVDCADETYAARPTLRRLNRFEYRRTIQDLLGVDFRSALDFPSDEVGHGFDNIGDVLTLSPLHLEKYLAAAEAIVAEAIVVPVRPRITRRTPRELKGGVLTDTHRELYTNGDIHTTYQALFSGAYLVRVRAYATRGGDELVQIAFVVNDESVHVDEVAASRDEPGEYEATVNLPQGESALAIRFLNDFYDPDAADPDRRDRNLYVVNLEIDGPLDAPLPSPRSDSHRQIFGCGHNDGTEHGAHCAGMIIERLARRAFRRPVSADELQRLLQIASTAQSRGARFEEAIQHVLAAILVSPHFLFRVESLPNGSATEPQPISQHELATRMSYFLWSSMPDEELFAAAAAGKLHEPGVLRHQVDRMLQDQKSQAIVDQFAMQWLNLGQLVLVEPDPERFPDFDESLRQAMLEESRLFFKTIIRADRSILDLLLADDTLVNGPLAKHYGIDGIEGDEFQPVKLSGTQRGGVLTQASVLTITSNPTRTSAVKRGKWILENLLGTPPPPPPENVEPLADDNSETLAGTLRQRLEQHRTKLECATCHERMDPLGFALENYDAIGAWRDHELEHPIDSSGRLPDGTQFSGPRQLQEFLYKEKREEFCRCFAERILTYALGRGLQYQDRCTVDELVESLRQNDYKFSSLVQGIVTSTPFRMAQVTGNH